MGAYWLGQDYFDGFSYALGCSLHEPLGALSQHPLFVKEEPLQREQQSVVVTLFGGADGRRLFSYRLLWITDASRILSLFGAKALGLGKPLMALATLVSVSCGYWWISRRLAQGRCTYTDAVPLRQVRQIKKTLIFCNY